MQLAAGVLTGHGREKNDKNERQRAEYTTNEQSEIWHNESKRWGHRGGVGDGDTRRGITCGIWGWGWNECSGLLSAIEMNNKEIRI